MAENPSPFRYRTVLEIAAISLVIYFFLGTPGLSYTSAPNSQLQSHSQSGSSQIRDEDVPLAKAAVESLLTPDRDLRCPAHAFKNVHIFSTAPLVVYIDGFLSDDEADHLVDMSSDKWQPSTVFNRGVESTDEKVRKSEKAMIDRDTIVQCIEARALAFQGWPEKTYIEQLWTQRYNLTGHYAHHYDYASNNPLSRRSSTFMVYLSPSSAVFGGGTNFPRLSPPSSQSDWCEFIECDGSDEGVTFKVRKGAAVFWMNFDAEGRGYKEVIHAGLPVREGTKVGLNIWSWYQD